MNGHLTDRRIAWYAVFLLVIICCCIGGKPTSAAAVGTKTIGDVTGVTRSGLIGWLESHRFDSYYLTTPYIGGDWRSPNGDTAFNGSAGMNCTGFVWHAYTKAGASTMPGLTGWVTWIEAHDLIHYPFYSKAEMLASGLLERGDVIWIWDGDSYSLSPNHHVGIFWGSNPSEDLFWHSSDTYGNNQITPIVGKSASALFTVVKTDRSGLVDLMKVSSKPQVTQGNSDFSLSGAVFTLYKDSTCLIPAGATITTNASGYGISKGISAGTYYVKETTAPKGYELNTNVYTVTVVAGTTTRVNGVGGQVPNAPARGRIDLVKRSSEPTMSSGNSSYSLQGAAYSVYSDSAATQRVTTLRTNAQGAVESIDLDAGTYYVRETTAAPGYALDPKIYAVEVRPKEVTRVNRSVGYVVDIPQRNPLEVAVVKVDAETGEGKAQAGASLADAHFEIKHYGGSFPTDERSWLASQTPLRSWIIATDETGKGYMHPDYLVSGDGIELTEEGLFEFPLGMVTVEEVKAPEGYLLAADSLSIHAITAQGTSPIVEIYQEPIVPNRIKRGDLELTKVGAGSFQRLSKVGFKLTSVTTGESAVIVTDDNGYASTASSWNPHSQHTNRGKTCEDGVWFGHLDALDDSMGALPYDRYLIEELESAGNFDRPLIPPFEIVISRDNHTVSLGTLINEPPIVPELRTTAVDGITGSKFVCADEEAIIVDTVTYTNLDANSTYRLQGILMDKQTGEPLLIDGTEVLSTKEFSPGDAKHDSDDNLSIEETASITAPDGLEGVEDGNHKKQEVLDDDGYTSSTFEEDSEEEHASQRQSKRYVNGTVALTFEFDASQLAGRRIVVFEYLYQGEELIASHDDIDDVDQTVEVVAPWITTVAREASSATNHAEPLKKTVIIDTVSYANLAVGKEYVIRGILMSKASAAPLIVDDAEVTAERTFTPVSTNGTVEVVFSFDASLLAGCEVVVFEYVYRNGREIASHIDLDDEHQTVRFNVPPLKPPVVVRPPQTRVTTPTPSTQSMPRTGDSLGLHRGVVVVGLAGMLSVFTAVKRRSVKISDAHV